MSTGFITAAAEAGTYGVPARIGSIASKAGWGIGSAALALNVGVATAHDVSKPYLDDDRRVSNAVARGVMLVAGGLIIGMSSGVLLPVGIAVGAGIAFSILDKELGITEGLADGIDWATDQTSAAGSDPTAAQLQDAYDECKVLDTGIESCHGGFAAQRILVSYREAGRPFTSEHWSIERDGLTHIFTAIMPTLEYPRLFRTVARAVKSFPGKGYAAPALRSPTRTLCAETRTGPADPRPVAAGTGRSHFPFAVHPQTQNCVEGCRAKGTCHHMPTGRLRRRYVSGHA